LTKLQITVSKTKELIFRHPSACHFTASQPLPLTEQVTVTKLLGIYISATFSTVTCQAHPYYLQYTAQESGLVACCFTCYIYCHCLVRYYPRKVHCLSDSCQKEIKARL